ncbi:DUF4355 domain-containing protein [Paenibacillus thailandensis]|uniref:DUF4355 domain-containing protein n=1 Tax=Paenibacillus thailandensis TaxID=393250 RepID=A0ABW5QUP0_9BACL
MQKRKYKYMLDLQTFAEGGAGADGAGGAGPTGPTGDGAGAGDGAAAGGAGEKTFTQADVDRILGERLGKEKAKWEKDFTTKLEEAKTEAQKLAKMNAEQKAEYERQQREDALAKRESEITRRELRATALETLAEKGLPKDLAEILVYTDADSTNQSIEAVEKAFRAAVEAGVNERLKGTPPKGGGAAGGSNSAVPDAEAIKQQFSGR